MIISAAVAAIFLLHAGGCGADRPEEPASDGGAALGDVGTDRRSPKPSEGPSEPTSPLPGWRLFTDYDPACGFYYPTERKYLPPPVEWEPCSVIADALDLTDAGVPGPPDMVCERMATPWAKPGQTGVVVFLRSVHVEDQRAYLLVDRVHPRGAGFTMVAEADGPVRTALYNSGTCLTDASDEARFGNVIQRVHDSSKNGISAGGAMGGSFDNLKPRVYFPKGHQPSTLYSHEYAVGRSLFVESAVPDRVYSFTTGELIATISPTPEDQDLFFAGYRFYEDALFWIGSSARRSAVKVWTTERGIFTLLDHDHDPTRRVAGFATDGVDMVWMEGRGRTNLSSLVFDVYEHWT